MRPTEVDALIDDYSKAKEALKWKPTIFVPELARIMVNSEYVVLEQNLKRADNG